MPAFTRKEMEDMMRRWLEANRNAEKEGNWKKHLGPLYTDDAVYRWNVGPHEEFYARGRKEIEEVALGYQMEGFQNWNYPYDAVIIDERRGEVVCFWRQVAPAVRDDGSPYEVAGIGGSWFTYAGKFKWSGQRDFFDFANVKALLFELAGDGRLDAPVKRKIHLQAMGSLLPGHERIRPKPGLLKRMKNYLVMLRIALLGK